MESEIAHVMKRRLQFNLMIIGLIAFNLVCILPTPALGKENSAIQALYVNQWNPGTDPFLTALSVDKPLKIIENEWGIFQAGNGQQLLESYNVVILVDPILNASTMAILRDYWNLGGGILYICGPHQAGNPQNLIDFGIIRPVSVGSVQNSSESAIVRVNSSKTNPYTSIDWNSCPEVTNYTELPYLPENLGENVVVDLSKRPRDDSEVLAPQPIYLRVQNGGQMVVSAGWLAEKDLKTQHLWPYFNYFVYSMVRVASQESKLNYADWQYSPVPHRLEQILWTTMVGALIVFTIFIYSRQKKKSRQALDQEALEKIAREAEEENLPETSISPESGELQPLAHEEVEAIIPEVEEITIVAEGIESFPDMTTETGKGEPRLMKEEEINEWEEIGYHRQLSGFLFALFMALFLLGPQLLLTLWLYPVYILPFPQAAGDLNDLLRGFSLPVNDFRKPISQGPVVIDARVPQILEREVPQAFERGLR